MLYLENKSVICSEGHGLLWFRILKWEPGRDCGDVMAVLGDVLTQVKV